MRAIMTGYLKDPDLCLTSTSLIAFFSKEMNVGFLKRFIDSFVFKTFKNVYILTV